MQCDTDGAEQQSGRPLPFPSLPFPPPVWDFCLFRKSSLMQNRILPEKVVKHLYNALKKESLAQTIAINTWNWVIHSTRRRKRGSSQELGFYQSQGQRSSSIYLCTARVGLCSRIVPNVLKFRKYSREQCDGNVPTGEYLSMMFTSVTQHLTRCCNF